MLFHYLHAGKISTDYESNITTHFIVGNTVKIGSNKKLSPTSPFRASNITNDNKWKFPIRKKGFKKLRH